MKCQLCMRGKAVAMLGLFYVCRACNENDAQTKADVDEE